MKARLKNFVRVSTGSSAPYRYKSLSLDDSIRVLELKPAASPQIPIHCSLTEIKLSPKAQYEALSYVWGPDEFPETLNLPDGHLKITKNLASALRSLRMTNRPRILWVDAVCINQSDDIEKGSQVGRMASVYKNASGVIAWLGDDSKETPVAMEAIVALSQTAKDLGLATSVAGQRDILVAALRQRTITRATVVDFGGTAQRANSSLLYGNDWFTRMWIVQEALLATRLTFYRGSKSLSWEDFERVMILLHTIKDAIHLSVPNADSFLKHAWNLVLVRDHYQHSSQRKVDGRFDFAYYMTQLRRRDCKDERDRLYALKSLIPESSDLAITPDYKKSDVEVFTDLALQQLQHGHIEILYQAGLCRNLASIFHAIHLLPSGALMAAPVPTWVPDYRKKVTYVGWQPFFGDNSTFLPNPTTTPACTSSPDNPWTLTTRCTFLDVVRFALPLPFVHDDNLRADHPKIFFMIREVLKELYTTYMAVLGSQPYLNEEDLLSAFAQALMGGGTSEKYRESFKSGVDDEVASPLQVWKEYEKQCLSEEGQLYQEMLREVESTEPAKRVNGIRQEWYQNSKNSHGAWELTHYLKVVFRYHVSFMTKKGYIGLAPLGTKKDTDVVVFVDSLKVPFILRNVRGADWNLVGPCYVHGITDTEAARSGAGMTFHII
jgi:hypothetical protein